MSEFEKSRLREEHCASVDPAGCEPATELDFDAGWDAREPEIESLRRELDEAHMRLEQSKKLYELTLENEMRWMKLHTEAQERALKAEAACAENHAYIKVLYDHYMGEHACGDFTCECGKPKVCGTCYNRIETKKFIARSNPGAALLAQLEKQKKALSAIASAGDGYSKAIAETALSDSTFGNETRRRREAAKVVK